MTIDEILEAAKTRANLKSDYALAKAMGIDRSIVSSWRRNKAHPSNAEAVQLATLAGMDEMTVIAEIEKQTAKTPEKRKFWELYLEQHSAAIVLTIMGAALLATPTPAKANESLHNKNYCANSLKGIYIMRIIILAKWKLP